MANRSSEDLETSIREIAYTIRQYETIQRESSDPKEQLRARREIEEQTSMLKDVLIRYITLYRKMNYNVPQDICEIAAIQDIDLDIPTMSNSGSTPQEPGAIHSPPQSQNSGGNHLVNRIATWLRACLEITWIAPTDELTNE